MSLIVLFNLRGEQKLQYTAMTDVQSAAVLEVQTVYPGAEVVGFKPIPPRLKLVPYECPDCGRVYTEGLRVCSSDDCPSNDY